MTDNITLRRAVAEEAARFIDSPNTRPWPAGTQYRLWKAFRTALDAALAEPDVADLFAQFAAKQRPLDADMAAIINANLDSLYITDEPAAALAEPSLKVSVDPTAFTASAFSQAAVLEQAEAFETAYQTKRAVLDPALAEPPAKPEPVAWRTFDGEYDYEYRGYKYNENYAAEWLERNPGYVGWVEPLYTAPPAAAKREPATDEQVTEAYISPDIDGRWRDFELGFRAAERFHGIGGSK